MISEYIMFLNWRVEFQFKLKIKFELHYSVAECIMKMKKRISDRYSESGMKRKGPNINVRYESFKSSQIIHLNFGTWRIANSRITLKYHFIRWQD